LVDGHVLTLTLWCVG